MFHLIAAGKPDAPYNCSLANQTSESLEVDCSEGKSSRRLSQCIAFVYLCVLNLVAAGISVYLWGSGNIEMFRTGCYLFTEM